MLCRGADACVSSPQGLGQLGSPSLLARLVLLLPSCDWYSSTRAVIATRRTTSDSALSKSWPNETPVEIFFELSRSSRSRRTLRTLISGESCADHGTHPSGTTRAVVFEPSHDSRAPRPDFPVPVKEATITRRRLPAVERCGHRTHRGRVHTGVPPCDGNAAVTEHFRHFL